MLQLKNIVKDYGSDENKVHALKGVSINFRSNELVSILGPSGCGKTTLLNIIGGLDRYNDGDLIIKGKSTKEYKDKDWDTYRNHEIGFVFQNYNLIPHLSVIGNVEIALTLGGVNRKERHERAKEALIKVGLESQINKMPNQLSGGQMQRVAIARALVNNPNIILADEPTGALDTETSVQVMEILKEIAKDKLVIMVTHNPDLAEKYSTRIIHMLDGEKKEDSSPYEDVQNNEEKVLPVKDSKMGFWTSLTLSFKNLLSKKGRTIMISLAGSIGIIGIALVLAISNGFTNYINDLQSNMLGGYPVTISQFAVDYDAIQQASSSSEEGLEDYPEDDRIFVYNPSADMESLGHLNMINRDYVNYVKTYYEEDQAKDEEDRVITSVKFSYAQNMNVISKNSDGNVSFVSTNGGSNTMMDVVLGTSSSYFNEALDNTKFIQSNYDIIYGRYPTNYDEVTLVIDQKNRLSTSLLDDLNIKYESTTVDGKTTYSPINFEDLVYQDDSHLGMDLKVVYNDYYYEYSASDDWYLPAKYNTNYTSDNYVSYYNSLNDDKSIKLKVVGVLRINEKCSYGFLNSGILYLPSLTQKVYENSVNSSIVVRQNEEFKNLAENSDYIAYCFGDYKNSSTFNPSEAYKYPFSKLLAGYSTYGATDEYVEQLALQKLCGSDVASAIYIYPKNFNDKSKILTYLDAWNEDESHVKIVYTDAASVLTSSLGTMVNIIKYVLIAFAGISLVVSSIMIGIITYTSVIERTKEIGVLRSLGARKKDISAVFNAETLLIGLVAGVLGVLISYVLCVPINALILKLAAASISSNLAVLNPLHALILIIISIVLTLISGLIPSRIAAKKDPVIALRTE